MPRCRRDSRIAPGRCQPALGRGVPVGPGELLVQPEGRLQGRAVLGGDRAAREPWLGNAEVRLEDDGDLEARCGSADHQGVCAEVSELEYADGSRTRLGPGTLYGALYAPGRQGLDTSGQIR